MGTPGRFVWHDLMTTGLERARGFYSALFGWRYEIADMGEFGEYTVVHAGERAIGGMVPLDPAHGASSHWIAYVTVDDLEAAVARGEAAGGVTCVPPTPIPNVGRFAVVTDPTGAVISPFVYASAEAPEAAGPPDPGTVCWNELVSGDPDGVRSFYQAVFGWGHGTIDMVPEGVYRVFKRAEKDVAGMIAMPPEARSHSAWVPYFAVAGVDAAFASALALGGCAHLAPQEIPRVGRFAVLGDPTGAAFALFAASLASPPAGR